jgi:hypothetical protein
MKRLVAVPLMALAFAACNKPAAKIEDKPVEAPAQVAAATPQPASAPVEIPRHEAPTATPAPTPVVQSAPRELAPEGVFYLIKAERIETPDGIVGLTPGTGVKLVREGVYLTPSGEAAIPADSLTNDMALARQVMKADREAQAAIKTAVAPQANAVAMNAAAPSQTPQNNQAAVQAEKNARLDVLYATKKALHTQLSALQTKHRGEQMRATYDKHIIASSSVQDIKVLSEKIAAVEAEISALSR